MTPNNTPDSPEDDSLGVLDEAASLDTTALGILGQTAQVNVALPRDEDDDLVDDSVLDGEIPSELVVDGELDEALTPAPEEVEAGRIHMDRAGIVIELPLEDEPDAELIEATVDPETIEPDDEDADAAAEAPIEEAVTAEVVVESEVMAAAAAAATSKAKKSKAAEGAAQSDESKPEATKSETKPATIKPAEPKPESATSAWIAAAMKQDATASPTTESESTAPEAAANPSATTEDAPTETLSADKTKSETVTTPQEDPKPAETAIVQRPAAARPEVALTSKRLGDQIGQSNRESADLLTADRLLDPHQLSKPEPEGAWSHFLYAASGRRINIGDGKKARARKALSARIAAPLVGGARFVPVLSRKGGVGKTTITALLGMALADARDDRVIAVDANPDRGTLADRIVRTHNRSVRDLVRIHDDVKGYQDVSAIVARDTTRLDVLASDSDPRVAEAFSDDDYRDVAHVAAHYYSLVLTDTGTGIVHSVMGATLDLADQLVIVSGLSVDEARLASETLTWLETNGYEEQARNAIIVLNQSTPGSPLVRLNELESHFATRAKSVVRMPYDPQIAGGGAIVFSNLQAETRQAARELAALLVEGLRASAA